MRSLFYLGLLLLAACVSATKYSDCGSVKGQITSVHVEGCPDSDNTCSLAKGTTPAIEINFISKGEASEVNAVIHGIFQGVPVPFPVPQLDGCKSGLSCPIKNGQSYTFKNVIVVRKSYPPLPVTVRYELKSGDGFEIVCVEIPSKIH